MGKLINLKKDGFRIENKTQTTAEIIIYADIGDSWWGDSVTAKSFSDELKELPDTVNQIDVRINSPGGDVFQGVSIYNRLKQHKANITVYIDGLAASIASIIALAGDEIVMGEGSLFMIHRPLTMAFGNASDLEETINRLDDVEEQLVNIYRRKTGLDRSEIKTMLAAETWLDADQALEYGFVDKKMAEDEAIDIAASLKRAKWINKMPDIKTKDDFVKKQVNNLKKNVEEFLAR